MPAYLLEIPVETCATCGRKATVRLYNGRNAPCGTYCGPCGKAALKKMEGER